MKRTILVAALFATATSATAAERTVSLSDVSVITDPSGNSRCLFRAADLATLQNVAIARAALVVPFSGEAAERTLRLAVYPVTSEWSAGSVSWSSGWTREGGDFDEEIGARAEVDLRGGSAVARFDVTAHVKEWLEEGASHDGFLLTAQPEFGEGVSSDDVSRLGSLTGARLEVVYRTVAARPRGRG